MRKRLIKLTITLVVGVAIRYYRHRRKTRARKHKVDEFIGYMQERNQVGPMLLSQGGLVTDFGQAQALGLTDEHTRSSLNFYVDPEAARLIEEFGGIPLWRLTS